MIPKGTLIFADKTFLNETGSAKEGADIYVGYLRCHPDNLEQVKDGIKATIGFDLEVVYKMPEIDQNA